MSYRIAAPDEYLAITGMNVKNVTITKAAWVWPFQRCMRFSVQPHDYGMNLQAMTKEKLQFLLPVVFTIGPDVNARGANAKVSKSRQLPQVEEGGLQSAHIHDEDRGDALMKYAMLLADSTEKNQGEQHLDNIVKGIIEGETRVLVSSMTMEEIFTEREEFKRRIFRNIQGELDQFGLKIYNANVKELKDAAGSTYFQSLSQKAHEGATNQARIDVADAQLRGNVGEADRHGQQERQIAKINAETAVQKTDRDVERAKAEANLATQKTVLSRDVEIARIQATRTIESRDEDLKKDVQVKRAAAEIERLRATDVVKAAIAREAKQQAADAKAYEVEAEARANFEKSTKATDAAAYKTKIDAETQATADFNRATKATEAAAFKTKTDAETQAAADFNRVTKATDAQAYKTKTDADAQAAADFNRLTKSTDAQAYKTKIDAEADYNRVTKATDAVSYKTRTDADAWGYATISNAEANLQKKLKEAEGLSAMADAYAKMNQAFGGPAGLLQYLMIERGTYIELAKANATAVSGMQPKISVWNTGPEAGSAAGPDSAATMRNVYQLLPPLMSTIHDQTGITLPEWQFGRMPATDVARPNAVNATGKVNGPK
ncbi:hypothetical protein F4779DRAFT_551879 [Xylariaceae sp. FL0662B]|nr:hypothetical protein F4779DRAFT_551879 [Xylariaceae sp. FL0662B]